jgi:inner membrane protein
VFNDYTMILLPQELILQGDMKEAYRQRGIYKSLVYTAELTISGHYNIKPLFNRCANNCNIKWDKAWIALGISDTKAINETSRINWGGSSASIQPGTLLPELIPNGFHASLKNLEPETELPNFRLRLSLNGSRGIRFAPLGEMTQATIKSAWPHPSYQGDILPKKEKHDKEGFLAQWQIPNLARNYPQYWLNDKKYNLNEFTTGVDLFEPVTLYSKISRATKYGILFIILTFITFLIFELIVQARPHFLQYTLIGFAISLFYLLLISLAEHVTFLHAYATAAGVTVLMITLYAAAILKKFTRSLLIFFLLSGLHTVLYTIMHLEDYALLAGAFLLLIVMGVLMLVTRNIQTV